MESDRYDHLQDLFWDTIIVVHVFNGAGTFGHGPSCTGGGSGSATSHCLYCIDMMAGCGFTDVVMKDMLDSVFVRSTDTAAEV